MSSSFGRKTVPYQHTTGSKSLGVSNHPGKSLSPSRYGGKSRQSSPKPKRNPSCETLPYDGGKRSEDTHEDIKEFLGQIKNEIDETEDLPRNSKLSTQFTGVNRTYSKLRRSRSRDEDKLVSSSSKKPGKKAGKTPADRRRSTIPETQEALNPPTMDPEETYNDDLSGLSETTKFTELEIVSMWNHLKSNFPSGMVNKRQLIDLLRQVFPRCTRPDVIVDNIFRLFDSESKGTVAFRELLMTFAMSMKATPRDKLHWIFRLYDKDGNEEIDEDEMTDIFVRLYKVALGAETVGNAPNEPPVEVIEKPPTPTKDEKKPKKKKKPQASGEIQVKTMSSKLSNRSNLKPKTVRKKRPSKTEQEMAEEAAAAAEKARAEAEAAERAAAEKAKAEEEDEDEEEKFDPVKRALEIFVDLDIDGNGVVTEDEFVEGCLTDPNFLFMLEHFSCDFIWGDEFQ